MANFLDVSKEFNKNSFQCNKHLLGLFQKFTSDLDTSVAGEWLLSSNDCNKSPVSQKFKRTHCLLVLGSN